MNTKLILCGCPNEYQDTKYGPGMRVHNPTKQSKSPPERGWRCTVCGREK